MSSAHRSPEGTPVTLPSFLVTIPRTTKSHDIFRLSTLCHISIKVESYKFQSALTQYYNCQKYGHVWANCKQPPRCLWCGGGHLHKGCPEKGNTASTQTCCNCQLAEGEAAHPANYRVCRHAKEEIKNKKSLGTPKNTTGRVFSLKWITTNLSFPTAVRIRTDLKTHQETATSSRVPEHPKPTQ
jgi:hypothetical protein